MTCQETQFYISEGTQSFFIALSPMAYTFFRVLGPDGSYKGYLMSNFNFPPIYYTSQIKATLNAKRHTPMAGQYTLQMITLTENQKISDVQYEIYTNEAANHQLLNHDPTVVAMMDLWTVPNGSPTEDVPRYYKGDLHAHTFLSDGVLSGDGVAKVVSEKALDFIAITDHNLVPMGFHPIKAIHIPAFELTLPKGHMNIHGLENPDIYKDISAMDQWSLNEAIKTFSPTCHVVINHPFFPPWDFNLDELDLSLVHALELICDPNYPGSDVATEIAVSFLDFLWSRGIVLFAVGGSDSHSDTYGDPMTHVFASAANQPALLEGLKKGRVMITRGMALETSYLTDQSNILPGSALESIADLKGIEVKITPEKTMTLHIRVIYNGRCIDEYQTSAQKGEIIMHKFETFSWEARDFHWIRLEIKNPNGEWVGYVNPVYAGIPNNAPGTWGELMEAYRAHETKK